MGGSFISGKADPGNVDLTAIIDAETLHEMGGRKGAGRLRELWSRDKCLKRFRVSPCLVSYAYFQSPMRGPQTELEREYCVMRGAYDDWWQRARPGDTPKAGPTRETAGCRRGYLEVEW